MLHRINRENGFTLIELVCVLTIMGLATSLAIPVFLQIKASYQLETAARQMASDIRRWQYQAVVDQKYGLKLVVSKSERKYHLREGMVVRETRDLSTSLKSISIKPENFHTVEFYPTGKTSCAGTYALENKYNKFKYVVILNTTGRVRVSSQPLPNN